jgi:glycosyltransferase involved in cell wall biosynthesis
MLDPWIMRICFLNHNLAERGTYFRCFHLARHLVRQGHSVTAITGSPSRRLRATRITRQGVNIWETPALFPMPLRCGYDPAETLTRMWMLRHASFDVVHAFDCRPSVIYPALQLAGRNHGRLFTDWADWWAPDGAAHERPEFKLISRFSIQIETYYEVHFRNRAVGQTVINRALEERAHALGCPPDRLLRLRSGADTDAIRPLDLTASRRGLGLELDRPMALFAGYAMYDVDYMLEAFALLLRHRPRTQLCLLGEIPASLRQQARILVPGNALCLPGPVPFADLPRWLSAANVLLLPYRDRLTNRGRWPNKIGDYLAAGRPVVTHPTDEFGDLFAGRDFVQLSGDTPGAFADAIERVLAEPDRWASRCAQARAFAEQEMDWAPLAGSLTDFYKRMLASVP